MAALAAASWFPQKKGCHTERMEKNKIIESDFPILPKICSVFRKKPNKIPGRKRPFAYAEGRFYQIAVYFLSIRIALRNFAGEKYLLYVILRRYLVPT